MKTRRTDLATANDERFVAGIRAGGMPGSRRAPDGVKLKRYQTSGHVVIGIARSVRSNSRAACVLSAAGLRELAEDALSLADAIDADKARW